MSGMRDHEVVSIYPFSEEEVDTLMGTAIESVLMWATKDGWPIGVNHAFIWRDGKIWLTFASHRHRAAAIRRDNRVSVSVSSATYPEGTSKDLPQGGITFKGTGEFFDDEESKGWFYQALVEKTNPGDEAMQKVFKGILDSPLRTILCVTPVKKIMYNSSLVAKHASGEVSEDELGPRLSSDKARLKKKYDDKGIERDES
jgi:hypothetical protein